MALKIRLARVGAKKRPQYRIVVADVRSPRDGRFIEKVGIYNPLQPKDSSQHTTLNSERISYWLSKGAKPTDRVGRILGQAEIVPMPAQRNNPQKAKPKAKAQERMKEAEEAAKAEVEAAAAPAQEEAPAEEAAKAEVEAAAAPAEETQNKEAEDNKK